MVVRKLDNSRLSRHLLLLRSLAARWEGAGISNHEAVAVLAHVQEHRPEVFAEMLGDPLTGAWLAQSARRLRRSRTIEVRDAFQLGGIAAVAAMRLGLDCTVAGHSKRGRLSLPGLGEAVLTQDSDEQVAISVSGGKAMVAGSSDAVVVPEDGRRWRGLQRLSAGCGEQNCTIRIEDSSPYRSAYHAPAASWLSALEVDRWRALFADAWNLIVHYIPDRVLELASGVKALVPLVDEGDGSARSGTARDSVGAVGLTRPHTADDLAVTLIHEYQHSKLSAVLDLVPLYGSESSERHFAPWRTDSRPTSGLLQGVYAFLGVADAWRGLRTAPELEARATRQFAIVRTQVQAGLEVLETSMELTEEGRRFVGGIRITLDGFLDEPVPAALVKEAESALRLTRTAWLQRQS